MPSESAIMEKVHFIDKEQGAQGIRMDVLEDNNKLQWEVIEKIKESLSTVKQQIAAFGVVNTLILGWIAYKLTKGA